MGIFEKDVELTGITGGLCTETEYLVGYNSTDGVIHETCNYVALFSRLARYFEGKGKEKIESIQVIILNGKPPYLKEIGRRKLRGMYESHKKDLEQKVSS